MRYKGSAWDVAYAALFFASDESRFVSAARNSPSDGAVMAARWTPPVRPRPAVP